MFSFKRGGKFKNGGKVKPDYRDGRAFDPAAVDDGNIRVIITAVRAEADADGNMPVHLDWWNIHETDIPAFIQQAMRRAVDVSAEALREGAA